MIVTSARPATVATVAARTPVTVGEAFVGKRVIKQNLSKFGYGYHDQDSYVQRLAGAPAGYASLSDALAAVDTLVSKSAKAANSSWADNAFVVLHPAGQARFAVGALDSMLIFKENGQLVADRGYLTYDRSVAAVVNALGEVLRNDGTAGWWN
jgi:hypothetical protein